MRRCQSAGAQGYYMEIKDDIALLRKYYDLTEEQQHLLSALGPLYREWNAQINVISRKDIDDFYLKHVLHSLAISKHYQFQSGSRVLDLGTGGGFPGIPLAIIFPEVQWDLIDGTAKKIKVVQAVADALQLKNVRASQMRAEETRERYDFVTARAVTDLARLKAWSQRIISTREINAMPNGLLTLKGGDPKAELSLIDKGDYTEIHWLKDIYEEDHYQTKYLLYLQI